MRLNSDEMVASQPHAGLTSPHRTGRRPNRDGSHYGRRHPKCMGPNERKGAPRADEHEGQPCVNAAWDRTADSCSATDRSRAVQVMNQRSRSLLVYACEWVADGREAHIVQ